MFWARLLRWVSGFLLMASASAAYGLSHQPLLLVLGALTAGMVALVDLGCGLVAVARAGSVAGSALVVSGLVLAASAEAGCELPARMAAAAMIALVVAYLLEGVTRLGEARRGGCG